MRKDIALVCLIVATLALMVIPLSSAMIDVLLAVNITLSVMLLMVSVYIRHPSDFSTFPSVILIGTAFRLALSIGTTRLILSEAEAGKIIETFGEFVVSGSIAIGLVIFLIITVVQFIVVTKGAERVAEVGARFALDALPGKQMSIDAEARAGNITAEEAADRRKRLDRDSRFFGAMDGAMKFVKGDAIAGIIIICINLIGGVAVGMSVHGYAFGEAVSVYSLLTVGDGLVAQIPALLMSLCAGIIVTRADGEGKDLGSDISAEIVADPRVPAIGAPIVLGIGLIPGFPFGVFAMMALLMLVVSFTVRHALRKNADAKLKEEREAAAKEEMDQANNVAPGSDRFKIVLGSGIASELQLSDLEETITGHLDALYAARGVRFPKPIGEMSDTVGARDVVLEIDEVPVFRGTVPSGQILTTDSDAEDLLADIDDKQPLAWPVLQGVWLPTEYAPRLSELDLEVTSVENAVAYLAYRVYEQNLGSLFSNAVFEDLMAEARGVEPELMTQIEAELNSASLYKMFRYLIEDGVPLRPLTLVISSIQYWLTTADEPTPVILAECLRGSMKRQLCHRMVGDEGILGLAMLSPDMEALARKGLSETQRIGGGDIGNDGLAFSPEVTDLLLSQVRSLSGQSQKGGRQMAIVVPADLRRRFRNFLAANGLHISVLAPHEVSAEVQSCPLELIEGPNNSGALHGNRTRPRTMQTTGHMQIDAPAGAAVA